MITHPTSSASSNSALPEPVPPLTEPTPHPSTAYRSTRVTITAEDVINSITYLQAFVDKAYKSIKKLDPLPQNIPPAQTNAKTDQQRSAANGNSSKRWCFNMSGSGAAKSQSIPGNGADDEAEKKKNKAEAEEEKKRKKLLDQAEQLKRDLHYLYEATRLKCERKPKVKFDFKDPEIQLKFMDLAPNIGSGAKGSVDANDIGKNNVSANGNATVSDSAAGGDGDKLSFKEVEEGLDVISQTSSHLKQLMRTILRNDGDDKNDDESVPGSRFEATYIVSGKPKSFLKEGASKSSAFMEILKDFWGAFEELDEQAKLCLLYLSVFPSDAIITKKVLFYWWMGEMILQPHDDEREVNGILKKLVEKQFIEPVIKKRRLIGFMMDPLVRLVVVNLAEAAGFSEFDAMTVPTEKMSSSYKTFLVKTEQRYSRNNPKGLEESNLEKIRTLFNMNDPYPDFEQDQFSKMKNVNVLYLGRWQEAEKYSNRRHHIEVEKTEFLKGLTHMEHLIFLSFRGIAGITELPGTNILSKLTKLRVLDFSACYGLESLPDLSFLKKLTYLDLSQCYLLDNIPNRIASLVELRVLKGFLIGDSADHSHSSTLQDLGGLKKLRKLSIKSSRDDFPTERELECLKRCYALVKLTIIWGGKPSQGKGKGSNKDKSSASSGQDVAKTNAGKDKGMNQIMRRVQNLAMKTKTQAACAVCNKKSAQRQQQKPTARARWRKAFIMVKGMLAVWSTIYLKNLEKLDLQCFPRSTAPHWLTSIVASAWLPSSAKKRLKKLYISGGNLRYLGVIDGQPYNSGVKILRLKFLDELKMDWRELQDLFPHLVYLEKVRCPNLTFFPCDKSGIWLKKDINLKQLEEMDLGLSWSFLTRKSFDTLGEQKTDPDKVNPSQHKQNLNEENSSQKKK